MTLSTSLNLVVSMTGLTMAGVLIGRRRNSELLLAFLLAICSIGSAMIALQHATTSRSAIDFSERVEYLAGALTGPLLLLYTRGSTRLRDWLHALPAIPAAIFIPPITFLMAHQFGYTIASAAHWYRKRPKWAGSLIALFAAIHVVQLVRLIFNDVVWLRNIVPTSISVAILAVAVSGFQAAFPRVAPKYARSAPLDRPETILVPISQRIHDERIFADCNIDLDSLARRLEMTPHQLSQLLNEGGGTTFRDFITGFRLRDFCRQLEDPASQRLTIEALAERSGFGSRSGLYAAFRKRTGMTPLQYRRSILSTPNGTDKVDASPTARRA